MAPKLNRRRALYVLAKVDEILNWDKAINGERELVLWNPAATYVRSALEILASRQDEILR